MNPSSTGTAAAGSTPLRVITAPEEYTESAPSLFLGGGITGCPDWQAEVIHHLGRTGWVLLNPRRPNFPMDDPTAAEQQIAWEHRHLRRATGVLLWFPRETVCPIVLYELGAWSMTDKPLLVGTHPHYRRRQDVHLQTALARPEVQVVDSLDALVQQARRIWELYETLRTTPTLGPFLRELTREERLGWTMVERMKG